MVQSCILLLVLHIDVHFLLLWELCIMLAKNRCNIESILLILQMAAHYETVETRIRIHIGYIGSLIENGCQDWRILRIVALNCPKQWRQDHTIVLESLINFNLHVLRFHLLVLEKLEYKRRVAPLDSLNELPLSLVFLDEPVFPLMSQRFLNTRFEALRLLLLDLRVAVVERS